MAQSDWTFAQGYDIITDAARPGGDQKVISLLTQRGIFRSSDAAFASTDGAAQVAVFNPGKAGILGMYQDASNYYYGIIYAAAWPGLQIHRVVAGVDTQLSSSNITITAGQYYAVRFTCTPGSQVLVVGANTITGTDAVFTTGKPGLVSLNGQGRFDQLSFFKP